MTEEHAAERMEKLLANSMEDKDTDYMISSLGDHLTAGPSAIPASLSSFQFSSTLDFTNQFIIEERVERIIEQLGALIPELPRPTAVESYGVKYVKFKVESATLVEGTLRLGHIIHAMETIKERLTGSWQFQEDAKCG